MERKFRLTGRWPAALFVLLTGIIVAVAAFSTTAVNAQSGLVTGTVTDPDGALPPNGTRAIIVNPDGSIHGQAQVNPATGEFSLGPVPNGNYWLQARPPQESAFTPSLPVSLMMTGGAMDVGTVALTNPSVTGTVLAPDGVTPRSATVHVFRHDQLLQSDIAPDGQISLGGFLTGTLHIVAEPVGEDPFWRSPRESFTATVNHTTTVDLVLRPANITGRIVDPNGIPVSGARVHVWGTVHHAHRQDHSNATGFFSIGNLPADSYILRVEPPYGSSGLISPEPVFFTVPPPFQDLGAIAFRSAPKIVTGIVETNAGEPVENALVIANRVDHPGQDQALTNANGRYQMNLSGGLWALTVEPTPHSDPADWVYINGLQVVHFDLDLEPENKIVNFEVLTADSLVTGVVEMPDGSTPPITVTVSLRNNEGIGRSVNIDPADGSWAMRVPHGPYLLHVHPHDPAYAGPPPEHVIAPQNGLLNVGTQTLIERDATISGIITDESGAGVGGVRVVAWTRHHQGAQTRTNPDGTYTLAVMAGGWLVRPTVPPQMPYIYSGEAVSLTIESMQDITGIDFSLESADNTVVGILVDENGDPVSAQGWAGAAAGGQPVNGAPIRAGQFAIPLPDGSYDVDVHLAPGSEWLAGPAQAVSVSGGETITLPVPLLPQDATILGALWDPRQEIVPAGVNGHVGAWNPWTAVGTSINPANGTYVLPVSAGLWKLGYHVDPASGYVALNHHTIVPLESGQTLLAPLPVVFRNSALMGRVIAPNGDPVSGAVVAADGLSPRLSEVTLRTHTDANGRFRLPVPHGSYRLRAGNAVDGWLNPVIQTVSVAPDAVVNGLVLQFREPDASIEGTVSLAPEGISDGRVHIWAYSSDGAATHTTSCIDCPYAVDALSGLRWTVGAVYETPNSFYAVRERIFVSGTIETLDLVLQGPFPKPGPVVVTFDASEPQFLTLSDGTHIFVPAGAMPVSGEVTLHITPIATFPHQHHARLYKYGYAFIATDETGTPITSRFNHNVVITFAYNEAELEALGLRENRLKPAYYSTTTQSWTIPESYVVDVDEDRIVMQIDHFTDFTLLDAGGSEMLYLPTMQR